MQSCGGTLTGVQQYELDIKMAYYQCKDFLITKHIHIQSNTLKNKIL